MSARSEAVTIIVVVVVVGPVVDHYRSWRGSWGGWALIITVDPVVDDYRI